MVKFQLDENRPIEGYKVSSSGEATGKTAWLLAGTPERTEKAPIYVIRPSWPDAEILATGTARIGWWIAITGASVTLPDGRRFFEVKNFGKYS